MMCIASCFSVFLKSALIFSILSLRLERLVNQSSGSVFVLLSLHFSSSLHKFDNLLFPRLSYLAQTILNMVYGLSIHGSSFFDMFPGTDIINIQDADVLNFLMDFSFRYFLLSFFCVSVSTSSSTFAHSVSSSSSVGTSTSLIKNLLYPCCAASASVLRFHSANFFLPVNLM